MDLRRTKKEERLPIPPVLRIICKTVCFAMSRSAGIKRCCLSSCPKWNKPFLWRQQFLRRYDKIGTIPWKTFFVIVHCIYPHRQSLPAFALVAWAAMPWISLMCSCRARTLGQIQSTVFEYANCLLLWCLSDFCWFRWNVHREPDQDRTRIDVRVGIFGSLRSQRATPTR